MSLTPVEIRHVKFPRRPLGYARGNVERLLADVITSYEDVWRDRADLRDELDRLEAEVARWKELEALLRKSLVSAERAAAERRAQAGREADTIVEEARVRAREIVAVAELERERVRTDIRRLKALEADARARHRAFLIAAIDRLEAETAEREASGEAA